MNEHDINALLNADREQQCTPCQYCMFTAFANIYGNPVPPIPFPYPSPNYPPRPVWQKYMKTSTPSTDCSQSIKKEYLSLYRDFKYASQIELRDHISSGATPSDCRQQTTRTTDLDTSPETSPHIDVAVERDICAIIHPFMSGVFTTLVEEYLKLFEEMVNDLILLKATGIYLDDICSVRENYSCRCRQAGLRKAGLGGIDKPCNAEQFERLLRNELKKQFINRAYTEQSRVLDHLNQSVYIIEENEVCDCEVAAMTKNPFLTFLAEVSWPVSCTRHTTDDFEKIINKGKKIFLINCLKLLYEEKTFRSETLNSNMLDSSFIKVVLPEELLKISVKIYNLTIGSVQSAIFKFFKTMQYDTHKGRRRVLPPIPDKSNQYQGAARIIQSKNQIHKSLSQYLMSDLPDSSRDDVFESINIDAKKTVSTQCPSLKDDDPDEVFKLLWPTLQYEYETKHRRYNSIKRRHSQYEPFDQNEQACSSVGRQYTKYADPAKRHTYYGHDTHQLRYAVEQENVKNEFQKAHFEESMVFGNAGNNDGLEAYKARLAMLQRELRKLQHDMGLLQDRNYHRGEDFSKRHSLYEPRNSEISSTRSRYKSEPYDTRSNAYAMSPARNKHRAETDIAYKRAYKELLLSELTTRWVSPEMLSPCEDLLTGVSKDTKTTSTSEMITPCQDLSTEVSKDTNTMYTSNIQSNSRRRSYTFSNNASNYKCMLRSRSLPDLAHKEIKKHYVNLANKERLNNCQSYRWTESLKFEDAVTNILNMWTYDMIDYEKDAHIPRLRKKIMNYRKKFSRLKRNDIKEKYCYRHITSVFKRIENNESPIIEFKKPVSTPSYLMNCKIIRSRSCQSKLRYKTMQPLKDDFSTEINNWVYDLKELENDACSPRYKHRTYRNNIMRPNSFHLEPNIIAQDERRTRSDDIECDDTISTRNMRDAKFFDLEHEKKSAQNSSDVVYRKNLARPRSLHTELRHPSVTMTSRPKSESLLHSDILPQLNAWKRDLQELEKEVATPNFRYESLMGHNATTANFISETNAATSVSRGSKSGSVINHYSTEINTWTHNLVELEKDSCRPHQIRPKAMNRKDMPRAHSLHAESINATAVKQRPKSESVSNKEDYTAKMNTWKQELLELQKSVDSPYSRMQITDKNMAKSCSLHSELQPANIHRYDVDAMNNTDNISKNTTWIPSQENAKQSIINDKSLSLHSELRPTGIYRSHIETLRNKSDISNKNTLVLNLGAPISNPNSTQYKPKERRFSATPRQLPVIPNKKTRRHSHYETTGNFIHLLADRKATHLNSRSVAAHGNANYEDRNPCPPTNRKESLDEFFSSYSTYSDDSSSTPRARFFSE